MKSTLLSIFRATALATFALASLPSFGSGQRTNDSAFRNVNRILGRIKIDDDSRGTCRYRLEQPKRATAVLRTKQVMKEENGQKLDLSSVVRFRYRNMEAILLWPQKDRSAPISQVQPLVQIVFSRNPFWFDAKTKTWDDRGPHDTFQGLTFNCNSHVQALQLAEALRKLARAHGAKVPVLPEYLDYRTKRERGLK